VEEQRVNVVARFTTPVTGFGDAFRVDVRVTVAEVADALIVPSRALVRDGASWAAFVVTNGRAVRRAVTLGARSADGAEVRAGLAAGDAVVEYPPENLLDGSRVRLAAPPELPRE
jgi:HlyD family secretion protein